MPALLLACRASGLYVRIQTGSPLTGGLFSQLSLRLTFSGLTPFPIILEHYVNPLG